MLYLFPLLLLTVIICTQTVNACGEDESPGEEDKKFVRMIYVDETKLASGEFIVDTVLAKYVTHVIYAFAGLDRQSYEGIQLNYPDAYKKLFKLKDLGVIVMFGVGGWGDSKSDYRKMLNVESKRKKYAKNVAKFIKDSGLQGLDMDLEYPCCWQLECKEDWVDDRENFTHLMELLRYELDKLSEETGEKFYLTVAVYPARAKIPLMFEVEKLSNIVDYINIITYDLHVATEAVLMPGAAFKKPEADPSAELNMVACVNAWLEYKADRKKLVVGIPFYATSFTLQNEAKHCVGDPAKGVGTLVTPPFKQVLDTIEQGGWEVMGESYTTFATKGDQWMAYDDKTDVARKADYVRTNNFAGIMVWTIDKDYPTDGPCGKYPLISTIHSVLNGSPKNKVQSCTKKYSNTDQSTCSDV